MVCDVYLPFLLGESERASPSARIYLSFTCQAGQRGKLTSYCEALNYFLPTHTTNDNSTKGNLNIGNFKQLAQQSAIEYAEGLWMKALRCTSLDGV